MDTQSGRGREAAKQKAGVARQQVLQIRTREPHKRRAPDANRKAFQPAITNVLRNLLLGTRSKRRVEKRAQLRRQRSQNGSTTRSRRPANRISNKRNVVESLHHNFQHQSARSTPSEAKNTASPSPSNGDRHGPSKQAARPQGLRHVQLPDVLRVQSRPRRTESSKQAKARALLRGPVLQAKLRKANPSGSQTRINKDKRRKHGHTHMAISSSTEGRIRDRQGKNVPSTNAKELHDSNVQRKPKRPDLPVNVKARDANKPDGLHGHAQSKAAHRIKAPNGPHGRATVLRHLLAQRRPKRSRRRCATQPFSRSRRPQKCDVIQSLHGANSRRASATRSHHRFKVRKEAKENKVPRVSNHASNNSFRIVK